MAVKLSPIGNDAPFLDASGIPLNGGLLYTYTAGSVSTPETTYTTSLGSVQNANPIVLNSNGYPASGGNVVEIWLTSGVSYKFVLKTSAGVTVWSRDNIDGINDTTVTIDQWVAGPAPTYVGATSFTLVGDQTSTFQVGRRVKTTNSGGTVYSTITASVFGASTTVTIENDSGTLDAGLSAVSYGLISQVNSSAPAFTDQMPVVVNITDRTKRVRISASGLATGKTRVLTVPNQDFTIGPFARGSISGYTYANNGGDSIDIATGSATDSTNAYWLNGSALTKNITVAWAVGTGQGMLDTGAVGNSDYYIWVIARSDTAVVDYLASLSSTAPTMPASYDFKRLIGWFKRVGGTIVAFHSYETEGGGIEQIWDVPTLDVDLSNTLTTAKRTDSVKVPQNVVTVALLNVEVYDAVSNTVIWVFNPDHTGGVDPSVPIAPLGTLRSSTSLEGVASFDIRTDSSGRVSARGNVATIDNYRIVTRGFRWARRN